MQGESHPPSVAAVAPLTLGFTDAVEEGNDDLWMTFFNAFLKPTPRRPPMEVKSFPIFKESPRSVHPNPKLVLTEAPILPSISQVPI